MSIKDEENDPSTLPTSDSESHNTDNLLHSNDFVLDENCQLTFATASPLKPRNWSTSKKLVYTILYGLATFSAQFNSATMASESYVNRMNQLYGLSAECALLGTSLYVLGIAFGPMVFAPMSEMYGRKLGVFVPFLISALFTFSTSISYNVPGIMVTRFLAGFFAGAPIVSSGGVLADIWDPSTRGAAVGLYAIFVSSGPSFGPIISSLLISSNDSLQSWRIPQWFIGLVELSLFVVDVLSLHETYEPVLLSRYAKQLRLDSKQWSIHSAQDAWHFDLKETLSIHMVRPFAMLATPIVFLMALFASYVFGLFYLFITNIDEAFFLANGWQGTIADLPLIAFFIGGVAGCLCNILWARKYAQIIEKKDGEPIPEERLPIMIMLGWLMPAGLFMFGWTCTSSIPWIVPCIAIVFIGIGFMTIFQNSLNYLIDSFPKYSASVIAANTFLRSVFAASFPLFGKQLYVNLGVGWGSSVIGFIALFMIPIPVFFYKYGRKIRAKNPYANRVS
ncbi:DEKNAAC104483 [Brettanomyces naardenensis]|uniref:DEKNAAC104483 n=1 Tax=Brettanomyces naardenensis TaxID=13370 RepID=A0A448YRN1_BRENA|nr:DEKNAAC104483 [Brettanomyces naardenensis]